MWRLSLVHIARDRMRLVNTDDIYLLEADRGDTLVHRRGTDVLRDTRPLGTLLQSWPEHPFVQIHEAYAVHPIHILELRLRDSDRDWELQLEPPLNTVLPISRTHADGLWAALGA